MSERQIKFKISQGEDEVVLFSFELGPNFEKPRGLTISRQSDRHYFNEKTMTWTEEKIEIPIDNPDLCETGFNFRIPDSWIPELAGTGVYLVNLFLSDGESCKATAHFNISIPRKEPLPRGSPIKVPKPDSKSPKPTPSRPWSIIGLQQSFVKWRKYLITLLALLILLFLCFVIFRKDGNIGSSSPEEKVETKAQQKSIRELVREFFSDPSKRTATGALELMKRLHPQTEEDEDAYFRLAYFAASHGASEAFKPYAQFLDPSLPVKGTIKKDPVEAWHYYQKDDDKLAISKLRSWLDSESKSNSQAKVWLQELKKEEKINE